MPNSQKPPKGFQRFGDITIGMLKPSQLVRRRTNYRQMDSESYSTLKASMDANGFRSFVLVGKAPNSGEYEILDGHHRWQAAQDMGMESIPVVLLEANEDAKDLAMLSFNVTADILPEVYLDLLSEMNDRVGPEVLARYTAVDQSFLEDLHRSAQPDDALLASLSADTGDVADRSRGHGVQVQFPNLPEVKALLAWVCAVYEEKNPALAIVAALREMREADDEDETAQGDASSHA